MPCIISLKTPVLPVCSLPLVPKVALGEVLLLESAYPPIEELTAKVWFLEMLLTSGPFLPALGSVHLGKFYIVEGLADASGT